MPVVIPLAQLGLHDGPESAKDLSPHPAAAQEVASVDSACQKLRMARVNRRGAVVARVFQYQREYLIGALYAIEPGKDALGEPGQERKRPKHRHNGNIYARLAALGSASGPFCQ